MDFPYFSDADTGMRREEEIAVLYQHTFRGEWEKVVELYESKPWLQKTQITSLQDTALHMSINHGVEPVVERLIQLIIHHGNEKALRIQNYRGETPLHRAAARGSVRMCEGILRAAQSKAPDLIYTPNRCGEAPIFTAALHNHKIAFFFLHEVASSCDAYSTENTNRLRRRTKDGETLLHSAIRRGHFDLAFHIIQLYPNLVDIVNERGFTPLHVLAGMPSAFKSGAHLSWWRKILYHFIQVDPLKYDPHPTIRKPLDTIKTSKHKCPENYLTCYQFLSSWYSAAKKEKGESANPNNSHYNETFPQNHATCYEFLPFFCLQFLRLIGFGKIVSETKKEKQKHVWSVQILDELVKKPPPNLLGIRNVESEIMSPDLTRNLKDSPSSWLHQSPEKTEYSEGTCTALFEAARNGVIEIVEEMLHKFPLLIHENSTKENRNILMVAVINNQAGVFRALFKLTQESNNPHLWDDLVQALDADGNSILHLAAQGGSRSWIKEIRWYEFVKSFAPAHFGFHKNMKGETPGEIFAKEHEFLARFSCVWVNYMTESCSVVASLVATVSFAASSTVPGGSNHKSGRPTLEQEPAFQAFGFAALIALSFSVTALIMFLSVLISHKQATDFKKKIPVKLFMGLSSLFVSIVAMFVSFCAAHLFVVEDSFKKAMLPYYAAGFVPVSLALAGFSFYVDLLQDIIGDVR